MLNAQQLNFMGCDILLDNSKEIRGGKTSRTQEKGKTTAEMGGLREEGHEKMGENERWREGVADRKLWKEITERVARQYFT